MFDKDVQIPKSIYKRMRKTNLSNMPTFNTLKPAQPEQATPKRRYEAGTQTTHAQQKRI